MNPGDPFNPNQQQLPFAPVYGPVCRMKGLSPGAKLTHGALCAFAGKNGLVYPSVATLADMLAASERNIRRYLRELEEAELIRRNFRKGSTSLFEFTWTSEFATYEPRTDSSAPPRTDSSAPPVRSVSKPRTDSSANNKAEQTYSSSSVVAPLVTPLAARFGNVTLRQKWATQAEADCLDSHHAELAAEWLGTPEANERLADARTPPIAALRALESTKQAAEDARQRRRANRTPAQREEDILALLEKRKHERTKNATAASA